MTSVINIAFWHNLHNLRTMKLRPLGLRLCAFRPSASCSLLLKHLSKKRKKTVLFFAKVLDSFFRDVLYFYYCISEEAGVGIPRYSVTVFGSKRLSLAATGRELGKADGTRPRLVLSRSAHKPGDFGALCVCAHWF
jgi:hypothetical protein